MLVRDPKERADTAELAEHTFLVAGDPTPREPFSQVVTDREGTAVVTQIAGHAADVFGTLPRDSDYPAMGNTCSKQAGQASGRVHGLPAKGHSTPLPSGGGGGAIGSTPTISSAQPALSTTTRGDDRVRGPGWCSHSANPYVAAAMAASSQRPPLPSKLATHPSPHPPPRAPDPLWAVEGHAGCGIGTTGGCCCVRVEGGPTNGGAFLPSAGCPTSEPIIAAKLSWAGDDRSSGSLRVDEKAAMSAIAMEEAMQEARLVREQRDRLLEERAKKKVLWEEELQRELDYQKLMKATREMHRRPYGGGTQIHPE